MNLYEELGVDRDASMEEIKKAFRGRAHETHPDKGGSENDFKRINEARAILLDQYRRREYDEQLGLSKKDRVVGVSVATGKTTDGSFTVTVSVEW